MSARSFHKIADDVEYPGGWFLRAPLTIDGREVGPSDVFSGKYLNVNGPLLFPFRYVGQPLAFTYADLDLPVITHELASILRRMCPDSIQLIPAKIETHPGRYWVLNTLAVYECMDEAASVMTKWTEADGRSDKVGQYRMAVKLTLDDNRIGNDPLFRVKEWDIALIVRDDLKSQMERADTTGIRFRQLSTTCGG